MKRCVIHVGMFKTGSSSIQNTFHKQLHNLKWKYLDLVTANHGGLLSTIFQKESQENKLCQIKGLDKHELVMKKQKLTNRLSKELNSDTENLLISAEWLCSNAIEFPRLLDFRDLVAKHVENISIIGYVRTPKSYMESSFQETLKYGPSALSFERFWPKYQARLEKFDQAFGKENVFFWKFDHAKFPNGCVVQDLCTRLAIDFPVDLIKRSNESLSRDAVSFLYIYRKYYAESVKNPAVIRENKILIERLSKLQGNRLRFAWADILPVINANRLDIQWIEQRMGESFEEAYVDEVDVIRSEKDLLCYTPQGLSWLAEQLGDDYTNKWHPQMKLQEVADWLHLLRIKLASEDDQMKK